MIKREEMLAFGERLRLARTACGLKQDAVSQAAGIDRSTLSYYESGALFPSMSKLCRLSAILCLPVDMLLDGLSSPAHLFYDDPFDFKRDDPPIHSSSALLPENITDLNSSEQLLLMYYRLLSEEAKSNFLDTLSETVEAIQRTELDEADIVLSELPEEDD